MQLLDLFEGLPQAGILYHGTDVMNAARILFQNKVVGSTEHLSIRNNIGRNISGVSLTRSKRFAIDWKGGAGVVFSLDGSKLRANSKINQIDYYNDRRESEEFVYGNIAPLSRYLLGILMSQDTADYCIEHDENLIEGHKDFEQILRHPLLKIENFPGMVPYYNPRNESGSLYQYDI